MIRRFGYVSRATSAVDQVMVDDIRERSIPLNEAHGITGLLLCDGSRFLQTIEGPPEAISACYQRICADDRHSHVTTVCDEQAAVRQFGQWSLSCRYLDPQSGDGKAFLASVKKDVDEVHDQRLQALFIGFARLGVQVRERDLGLRSQQSAIPGS